MERVNRERLRALIQERGVTARALSLAVGDNDSLVKNILSGKSMNPRSDTLAQIAQKLEVPLAELLTDAEDTQQPLNPAASEAERRGKVASPRPHLLKKAKESKLATAPLSDRPAAPSSSVHSVGSLRRVRVIGEVRAGVWDEVMGERELGFIDIDLPQYRGADVFGLRVVGTSMDRFYPEGTTLICVKMAQADLREGDHVILQRRRGGLVETTVKEAVLDEHGLAFWPRSHDPEHQTPYRIPVNRDSLDEGAEIIGIVIRWVPLPRPRNGARINLSEMK